MIEANEWDKIRSELEQASSVSPYRKIMVWASLDCPAPPPSAYKQALVREYAKFYGITTIVETGTYLGQMVESCLEDFDDIHSIELSDELYTNAKNKFKDEKSVHLYQGDSGDLIQKILKNLKKPAIFWLDAHYSAGITAKGKLNTPILKELETVFNHRVKGHVILIDDARIFTGEEDYPTVRQVQDLTKKSLGNVGFYNRHDIIRIQPDDTVIDL